MKNDTLIKQKQKAAWDDTHSELFEQNAGYQKCETKKSVDTQNSKISSPQKKKKSVLMFYKVM